MRRAPAPLLAAAVFAAASGAGAADPAVAVWIDHPRDPAPETFPAAAARLEEIDISLVRESLPAAPDQDRAREILDAHRAVVVVWHEPEGQLAVLLSGASDAELFEVEVGTPDEEALYLREFLAVRVLGEHLSAELLITAPEEVVPPRDPPQLRLTLPRPTASSAKPPPRSSEPRFGPRLALGWRTGFHFDEVTWSRHGIAFHLPAWLFEFGLELRVVGVVGLPARIGDPWVSWLELSTSEAGAAAGFRPFGGRTLDAEVFAGAGVSYTRAAAFLADGSTASADHLSGQITMGAGLVWGFLPGLELRLHGGANRVLRPGRFSINGRGGFGAAPWQPLIGMDLSAALPL